MEGMKIKSSSIFILVNWLKVDIFWIPLWWEVC